MSKLLCPLLFLCLLPGVVPLFCYTCVFPTVYPLDCISFPVSCPPGQVCLSSKAVGVIGDVRVVLYERSCVLPALCGLAGENYSMGLNLTFSNECCNTQLCNGATGNTSTYWTATLILFFLISLYD